jgi:hypothetical protein
MLMHNIEIVDAVIGVKSVGKGMYGKRLQERHGYKLYTMSTPIRAVADREIPPDPATGASRYKVADLVRIADRERAKHGPGYWATELIKLANANGVKRLVVDGVRNPGEIRALQASLPSSAVFRLHGIVAPLWTRYLWAQKRRQSGDPLTFLGFLKMDLVDRGWFQPAHGQQVNKCLALVPPENLYRNVGTLEDYYAWIDDQVEEELGEAGASGPVAAGRP